MLITVDSASPLPIYGQLVAELRRRIADGDVPVGERLPSAGELADSLGLNRNTVLRAYRTLRDDGLVELRRGRGATVVAAPDRDGDLDAALDRVASLARAHGLGLADVASALSVRGLS
ncbi:GntR family transcriptional regulator [Corynebacterium sp.]|uniref:GntR family transcriptional regulator n=1 Tax=Corynebacterium sp. TaxID=1720 RepID=UPI0026DDBFAF|nr:GntR family transcriptional regulator [Corynebacterium sp.]MDO4610918.1 GntR family transcriptional regulator [Corynebacterium sp.]